jgi:flagellar biosynthetic protein FlhB
VAEEDSGQEKTEEATPKQLEKAREEGQVARSRELASTAVMVTGSLALTVFGAHGLERLRQVMHSSFALERARLFDPDFLVTHLVGSGVAAGLGFLPVLVATCLAGLLGPLFLGGWSLTAKPLAPKLERINPLKGLKRMFSLQALVELLKSILKVALVAGVGLALLWGLQGQLRGLDAHPMGVAASVHWAVLALVVLSSAMVLIALIDVPYQLWDHKRKLKMTKQQVKDESKDTEGRPEVRSRIRQLQRDLARSRMMDAIPTADVVITNPTHYAVALSYDQGAGGAPRVVAKGVDEIALQIRRVAGAHEVPVVSAPPLTRAVYHHTELNQEIPVGLYNAVAQLLAYVYQLRDFMRGRAERPALPGDLPIPESLARNA